jgi:23S rRNA (cytidine1920-2'-O)/16S rRNA (cytidine1409-2'-O)-methyltransferase
MTILYAPYVAQRVRLDVALVERGLEASRERARRLIVAGEVTVDGEVARAPAALVAVDAVLAIGRRLPYVSRGGLKLAHALDRFGIDVGGRVALDAGASTGGFTDCLLQRGAARVYAADVGKGLLAWKLRQDPRVVVMEGVNVRRLPPLPEAVSVATVDVAFISLRLVLPAVAGALDPAGEVVALVKPQFEAGPGAVGKGGVVRDPAVHRQVLEGAMAGARTAGLIAVGLTAAPIRGEAGNVEFLLWARPGGAPDAGAGAAPALDAAGEAGAIESALAEAAALPSSRPGRA